MLNEMPEVDVTVVLQTVEMAVRYAFYTLAFVGGLCIGAGLISLILGQQDER